MCWRHPLALALWYCMLFKPSVSTTSTAPRRAARRWCLSPPKSRVYLLKDRDAVGQSASRSVEFSNGIRYHIFDTRPDTEFTPSLRYDYPLTPPNTASRRIRDVGKCYSPKWREMCMRSSQSNLSRSLSRPII